MITTVPELKKERITNETSFLVIACDGIWDCLTSQDCVDLVGDLLPKKKKVSEVVE